MIGALTIDFEVDADVLARFSTDFSIALDDAEFSDKFSLARDFLVFGGGIGGILLFGLEIWSPMSVSSTDIGFAITAFAAG